MRARLRSLARSLFGRAQMERDMAEELRFHVERRMEDLIRAGVAPHDAERAATLEFGAKEAYKEECREARGLRFFNEAVQDLRYAFRTLKGNPGFTAVAILSLALGLGANTAIFSVLDALMLRSLPVAKPGELFFVDRELQRGNRFSYPAFERFQEVLPATSSLAAMSRVVRFNATLHAAQQSEIVLGQLVSGEYFSTLGLYPAQGRLLTPEDNRILGGHPVAVLSDTFSQRSRSVVGEQIKLNGASFTIVGIGPRSFQGVWVDRPVDVWIPLAMQQSVHYAQHYSNNGGETEQPWLPQEQIAWLDIIARANAGEAGRLQALLNVVYQRTVARSAERIANSEERRFALNLRLALKPFRRGFSDLRKPLAAPLFVLMGMVALVLLIACANLANLLLARSAGRRREIAVRLSIGAGRARLVRQLLTESVLLSVLGGVAGLLIAQWMTAALVRMARSADQRILAPSFELDLRVFGFAVALSLLTGVLFGLAPAFRATRVELSAALKATSRSAPGGPGMKGMRPLVAFQVALSLVLLVGAGLFARSIRNLSHVDPGFDREHLLAVSISPRVAGYSADRLPALYRGLTERLETVPGVRSVSISNCALVSDCKSFEDGIEITGYQRHSLEQVLLQNNVVSPKYFATVGIELLQGRDFDQRDTPHSAKVAIVNEATVRRYFAGRNPLGQRFGNPKPDIEIIGVVKDARVTNVHEPAVPMAYYSVGQFTVYQENIDVRAAADPRWIATEVRKVVAGIDPNLAPRVIPVSEQMSDNLTRDRLAAYLASAFGALALALACVGLYGVMSYAVARRTSELGIRMALGAPRGRILRTVLRDSLILVGLGIAVGLPLAFATSQLVKGMLFGLTPNDPATLLSATLALVAVASIAGYLPAFRASRLDPLVALRYE